MTRSFVSCSTLNTLQSHPAVKPASVIFEAFGPYTCDPWSDKFFQTAKAKLVFRHSWKTFYIFMDT